MRNFLIRIVSDPRKSPRPAEAVRIAAGVGAWRKVQVHLYFEGAAARALDEFADELASGDLFTQYLQAIPDHGGRILVEAGNPILDSINPAVRFERLSGDQIEQFVAQMDHVMQF
jgi:hypothetical protein